MLIRFEIQMQLAIIIIIIAICTVSQEFLDGIFDQKRMAKYAHDFNNWPAQFEVVLNNCYKTVRYDGHMYLYPDCIFRFTPEGFDAEMLLDPFEKQFDLPPIAVEKGNFIPFEVEVVGVVGEGSSKVGGIEYDAPERNRIVPTISLACEPNRLVPQDIFSSFKHIFTFGDLIFRMGFLPYDEESSCLLDCEEPGEIKVRPVKHIAGIPFVFQPIHEPGIMHICMADPVENGNLCGDIDLGMNLDARLCASELGPFKDRHAQVDGSGIDRIEPSVEFELFGDPLGLGNGHDVKGKLLKDFGTPEVIGLGKDTSVDGNLSKSQMKRPFTVSDSDIGEFSKAMASNELAVHNDQHMAPMGWCHSGCPIFVIANKSFKVTFREELHNLCENIFAYVHICSTLHLSTKEQISKVRQGFGRLVCCA